MTLHFTKLVGAGNDFIFIKHLPQFDRNFYQSMSQKLCQRNFGIGADGLVGIELLDLKSAQFKWHFFNSDGSSAEMCGNAARCAVRYIDCEFDKKEFSLETLCGRVVGKTLSRQVETHWTLKNPILKSISLNLADGKSMHGFFINSGVPHFVILNAGTSLTHADCLAIQEHPEFQPNQTNVTLLEIEGGKNNTRTFERGVKEFTLACGTGVIASAFVLQQQGEKEVYELSAPGGDLKVKIDNSQVTLIGPAEKIFDGEIQL